MNMESYPNIHTHRQVAQAYTQPKTWQRVWLSQRTDEKRNNEGTTLCISNSGFSAYLKSKTINQRSVLSDSLVD